ncbi:hypothetical protein ILUMI_10402 [Ignelater luminosus]|uniref:Uncharacterized protein n=1 Tax=Ignelater luminosus TaxID=2038154 RepID=A0A8K0D3C7_IGNLU|nr:hypothetical protein ILUMI_10402 [Ignelater luminosus]
MQMIPFTGVYEIKQFVRGNSKTNRGYSEQTVRQNLKINIMQWYEQKPVLLASTRLGTIDECKRWSQTDKKYMNVLRSNIVTTALVHGARNVL